MEKFSLTFTKRNLAFLGICLGGLTLLVVISIIPLTAQEKELAREIPEIKAKISEQAQLVTILQAIDKKLQALETMENLPSIAQESLPIIESSTVLARIADLASEQNIKLLRIDPVIPQDSKNLKQLTFDSDFQGSLENIRSFVFSLLQIPFIEKIDKLRIKSNSNTLDLDLVFSVRIS